MPLYNVRRATKQRLYGNSNCFNKNDSPYQFPNYLQEERKNEPLDHRGIDAIRHPAPLIAKQSVKEFCGEKTACPWEIADSGIFSRWKIPRESTDFSRRFFTRGQLRGYREKSVDVSSFFFFFSPLTREALWRRRNHRKNNYEREITVDETKLRLFRIYERSKSNWYRSIERCPLFINPLVIPALLNGASSPTGPRARVIWIRCPVSPLLCVNCIIFTPNTFRP